MIGGLQGEFGDLDIKYLKQKNLKMSVANIGKLQETTAALCKMAAKLSGELVPEDEPFVHIEPLLCLTFSI